MVQNGMQTACMVLFISNFLSNFLSCANDDRNDNFSSFDIELGLLMTGKQTTGSKVKRGSYLKGLKLIKFYF